MVDIKETHVPDEEQKLVKADVLVCLLLVFFFSTNASRLDIPNPNWDFFEIGFDSDFLVDGFDEGSLPPVDVGPNMVIFDQLVQFNFPVFFFEVVSHGQHHEHLRVISI